MSLLDGWVQNPLCEVFPGILLGWGQALAGARFSSRYPQVPNVCALLGWYGSVAAT